MHRNCAKKPLAREHVRNFINSPTYPTTTFLLRQALLGHCPRVRLIFVAVLTTAQAIAINYLCK